MKSITTVALLIVFLMGFACQDKSETKKQKKDDVPEAVRNNFKSKYPGENDPDWKKDSNGNFESNFKMDGVSYRADFKPDGNWIETETSIDKNELPDVIQSKIASDYSDYSITEIEKVEHHSKGTFYDVEFKQKGKNKDVEFDISGNVIN